ncbi:MAG: hypothetical protein AAB352_00730 [Patescibacteria group bacterium]
MKNSKSVKKFIRTQKAQIRRQFFDVKKQEAEIAELYKKVAGTVVAKSFDAAQDDASTLKAEVKKPARNASHSDAGGEKSRKEIKKQKLKVKS